MLTRKYLQGWLRHAALNAGQAVRDIRYIHDYPGAESLKDALRKRLSSLGNNLKYTLVPPSEIRVGKHTLMKGHHTRKEIENMRGSSKDWFLRGYAPWDHPAPSSSTLHK